MKKLLIVLLILVCILILGIVVPMGIAAANNSDALTGLGMFFDLIRDIVDTALNTGMQAYIEFLGSL